jgi:hypothetical protein
MLSSGMLRRVALVRTDVLEELGASIKVTSIGELGTTQVATSNRRTLRRNTKEAPGSSETSFLARATRRNIPKDTVLHSHRRENLKSYNRYCISQVAVGHTRSPQSDIVISVLTYASNSEHSPP